MTARNNHNDVLLEDINSKFDAILEAVGSMKDQVKKIPSIEEKVINLENEMHAVRLATTDTNIDVKDIKTHVRKIDKQLDELEERLVVVESAH